MRIGILSSCPPPHGGVSRVVEDNARIWKKRGIKSYLIPMEIPEKPEISENLILVDYREYADLQPSAFTTTLRHTIKFARPLWWPRFFRYNLGLYNIVKELNLDILYAHHVFELGLSAVLQHKLLGVPTVTVSYGETWMMKEKKEEDTRSYRMCQYVLRNANCVISPSKYCRRGALLCGADPQKAKVVYAGVDLKTFSPDVNSKSFKEKYGIKEDEIVLSSLSHLHRRQGVHIFIKSLAGIKRKNLKVLIGGKGEHEAYFRDLAQKNGLDFVKFLGFVPKNELPQFYNATDVLVFPAVTKLACLGLCMLEAMACGVPVIGSNIGGIPEAVLAEKTGLLFKPNEPDDLSSKIISLVDDDELRKRFGRNAEKRVMEKFDAEKLADKHIRIFEEVIRGS